MTIAPTRAALLATLAEENALDLRERTRLVGVAQMALEREGAALAAAKRASARVAKAIADMERFKAERDAARARIRADLLRGYPHVAILHGAMEWILQEQRAIPLTPPPGPDDPRVLRMAGLNVARARIEAIVEEDHPDEAAVAERCREILRTIDAAAPRVVCP